jgi:hypothetical protein
MIVRVHRLANCRYVLAVDWEPGDPEINSPEWMKAVENIGRIAEVQLHDKAESNESN